MTQNSVFLSGEGSGFDAREGGDEVCVGDACVESGEKCLMGGGEVEKMRVCGGRGLAAPDGRVKGGLIVGQEVVPASECLKHALQHSTGFLRSDEALTALDGDTYEAKLGNGGSEELYAASGFDVMKPRGDPEVIGMIRPTPSDEHIDIQ